MDSLSQKDDNKRLLLTTRKRYFQKTPRKRSDYNSRDSSVGEEWYTRDHSVHTTTQHKQDTIHDMLPILYPIRIFNRNLSVDNIAAVGWGDYHLWISRSDGFVEHIWPPESLKRQLSCLLARNHHRSKSRSLKKEKKYRETYSNSKIKIIRKLNKMY